MNKKCSFKIRLLAQTVDVFESNPEDWDERGMGRSMLAAGRIILKEDMPEEIKMATLLHEILHFIADLNDLPIVKNEQVISGLANGLMTFFKDNHEVVKRIAGIKKGNHE